MKNVKLIEDETIEYKWLDVKYQNLQINFSKLYEILPHINFRFCFNLYETGEEEPENSEMFKTFIIKLNFEQGIPMTARSINMSINYCSFPSKWKQKRYCSRRRPQQLHFTSFWSCLRAVRNLPPYVPEPVLPRAYRIFSSLAFGN